MPQIPSIILPQVWENGTETELIDDLVTHPSVDIFSEYLEEKQVHIIAIEVNIFGVPGNLQCWIELSPVPSSTSTAFFAAIGGGGGALAPVAPLIEVATGVPGAPPTFASTVHTILLPWIIHSPYARLVVQTPVAAALPTAFWSVQALVSAKKFTEGL
ncbi:hypothetical protein ES703_44045 [subsurface metagenome]